MFVNVLALVFSALLVVWCLVSSVLGSWALAPPLCSLLPCNHCLNVPLAEMLGGLLEHAVDWLCGWIYLALVQVALSLLACCVVLAVTVPLRCAWYAGVSSLFSFVFCLFVFFFLSSLWMFLFALCLDPLVDAPYRFSSSLLFFSSILPPAA